MSDRTGVLSIESKNIISVLKEWLYTEQDIVFRELISNASDAIFKRCELVAAGDHGACPDGRIDVVVDVDARTLTIADNGLGMTADEVDRYLNQIAFSGASDFVQKYREHDEDGIIGHFGVGFYSAFMLSDRVVVEMLSYLPSAEAVRWAGTDEMAFAMSPGDRTSVGTTVTLELDPNSPYLVDPALARAAVVKYVAFLRTEIRYTYLPGVAALRRQWGAQYLTTTDHHLIHGGPPTLATAPPRGPRND